MKKLGWLILFCLFFVSCGKKTTSNLYIPPTGTNYSPLFNESNNYFSAYTQSFISQYQLYKGSPYTGIIPAINFYDLSKLSYLTNSTINISNDLYEPLNGTTGNAIAGVCLQYDNGDREILIDETVWSQLGSDLLFFARKRAIIFHELGHCVLNRGHIDDLYRNYKVSIMNSVLLRQNDAKRWQENYDKELFTQDQSVIKSAINIYIDGI
jgi:hypothetical protein